jgi:uncharacterized membrane protein YfcA
LLLTVLLLAALVVFALTTFLSIGGVGAALVIDPVLFWLGIPLPVALATGLLLNGLSMISASANNARNELVSFKWAVPVAVAAVLLSPVGVFSSEFVSQRVLLGFFSGFLLFAASMMIFYKPKRSAAHSDLVKGSLFGGGAGGLAGYVGGMLGIGGGTLIVPMLVWLGFDPKKASGTTSLVVVFASLAGFVSRASFVGSLDYQLLLFTLPGSIIGALLGSLLLKRLSVRLVKLSIAGMLLLVAAKIIIDLI